MSELARRYARALYELTVDEGGFHAAAELLSGSAPLRTALENPCVAPEEKESVLDAALVEASPLLRSFFKLLCAHGRLALLPGVAQAYHVLVLEGRNALCATMRSAFVPDGAEQAAISRALAARYGKDSVELTVVHAPELLGGFILTIANDTYDKSVLGAVGELRRALG